MKGVSFNLTHPVCISLSARIVRFYAGARSRRHVQSQEQLAGRAAPCGNAAVIATFHFSVCLSVYLYIYLSNLI